MSSLIYYKQKSNSECDLPTGWRRCERPISRKRLIAGRSKIVYQSPYGRQCTTKSQLARVLKEIDLYGFDFKLGRFRPNVLRARRTSTKDYKIAAPVRQTASIMRHRVTLKRSQESKSQVPPNPQQPPLKTIAQKPRQLFWMKRMDNLKAVDANHLRVSMPNIPQLQDATGLNLSEMAHLQCLSSSLLNNVAVGQNCPRNYILKNPTVYIDPYRPLIPNKLLQISEDDLTRQETRISYLRSRLSQSLKDMRSIQQQTQDALFKKEEERRQTRTATTSVDDVDAPTPTDVENNTAHYKVAPAAPVSGVTRLAAAEARDRIGTPMMEISNDSPISNDPSNGGEDTHNNRKGVVEALAPVVSTQSSGNATGDAVTANGGGGDVLMAIDEEDNHLDDDVIALDG